MNKKGKKLINNTFLFFIGNIGSKFIQFFLVPLYTYTLTTEQYGVTDVFFTTINFLIPIFSIQVSDGLLRFGLSKKSNMDEVINSSFKIMFFGTLASIALFPLIGFISELRDWILYFVIILNLQIYRDLLSIILKVKDMNKKYAFNNIAYTAFLCIFNILFLVVFKMSISGYFLAYIFANLISIVLLLASSKLNIKVLLRKKNSKLLKEIVLYSLPLVINSIAYWITMAADRYMISAFLGISSVGIYAVACKIPTLITTFSGIFNQAWMISSIDEYENERDSNYYSGTFDNYIGLTMICSALLILVLKPFMFLYVSPDYYIAWKYSSVLIFSAVFSGICAFINGIFYAYKKNVGITITTTLGAIINIILNLILIPKCGILGASIATLISWLLIAILRIIVIKKTIPFRIKISKLVLSVILITAEISLLIMLPTKVSTLINILITILVLYIEKEVLIKTINILLNAKKKMVLKYRNQIRKKFDLKNRERLKNNDFSIICSNCTAGVIYHNLGQQFRTPTINMYFEASDFVKFCGKLKEYLSYDLVEIDSNLKYPVAKLKDITIYGVHYKDFDEMKEKWNERKKRINYDNIYFMMTERDGCTYDDIINFSKIKGNKKIVFTHKKYEDLEISYHVKGTNNRNQYHQTKPLTDYKNKFSGFRYIDDFDYVGWLNGDDK